MPFTVEFNLTRERRRGRRERVRGKKGRRGDCGARACERVVVGGAELRACSGVGVCVAARSRLVRATTGFTGQCDFGEMTIGDRRKGRNAAGKKYKASPCSAVVILWRRATPFMPLGFRGFSYLLGCLSLVVVHVLLMLSLAINLVGGWVRGKVFVSGQVHERFWCRRVGTDVFSLFGGTGRWRFRCLMLI
ncbi:hypothetical protein E2542_SST22732 [Spatholobus suberectus]|nr:hypothetical protein E2542_SST22732 [Spatholobus suberectus]